MSDERTCEECGGRLITVVGERADCSYGEYLVCENGCDNIKQTMFEDREDDMTDLEADADTLKSAGWGTDEDYGYFGGEDF